MAALHEVDSKTDLFHSEEVVPDVASNEVDVVDVVQLRLVEGQLADVEADHCD